MSHKFYMSNTSRQQGLIALLIGISAMLLAATLSLSSVFVFLNRAKTTRNIAFSYESFYAAEAGVEDLLLRYYDANKDLPASYPSILPVGNAVATTTLSEDFFENATIRSEGDRENRFRVLSVYVSPTDSGTFRYAVQIGAGGLLMDSNATVVGNVYSNGNITGGSNSEIQGNAYAAGTISSPNPNVTGTKVAGVQPQDLPTVDIAYWKARANINNDPIVGNVTYNTGSHNLGPRKIDGNLTLDSNASLTINGPVHVTGNVEMKSNSDLLISESFVASSTVIVVEGTIEFNSNAEVHSTTSTPKGYLMLLSESTSSEAIEISSNQRIDGAVYAPNGTVDIGSNAEVTSLAGWRINLDSNAEITYNFGLRDVSFSGGASSGGKIISWKEQ